MRVNDVAGSLCRTLFGGGGNVIRFRVDKHFVFPREKGCTSTLLLPIPPTAGTRTKVSEADAEAEAEAEAGRCGLTISIPVFNAPVGSHLTV
jgi:hypothetical protein